MQLLMFPTGVDRLCMQTFALVLIYESLNKISYENIDEITNETFNKITLVDYLVAKFPVGICRSANTCRPAFHIRELQHDHPD